MSVLEITKRRNRFNELLRKKYPRGKVQIDQNKAAEEYVLSKKWYRSDIDPFKRDVQDLKNDADYLMLRDMQVDLFKNQSRKGHFPEDDLYDLSDFLECSPFDLFFKDVDDCCEYEREFLLHCINVVKNQLGKEDSGEIWEDRTGKNIYLCLGIKAVRFASLYYHQTNINRETVIDLCCRAQNFYDKYIFSTLNAFGKNTFDFFSKKLNKVKRNGDFVIQKDDENFDLIINKISELTLVSPSFIYESIESSGNSIKLSRLNDLIVNSFKRFRRYMDFKNNGKIQEQLEEKVVKNWENLFNAISTQVQMQKFASLKTNDTNEFYEDIALTALSDLGLATQIKKGENVDYSLESAKRDEQFRVDLYNNGMLSQLILNFFRYQNSVLDLNEFYQI